MNHARRGSLVLTTLMGIFCFAAIGALGTWLFFYGQKAALQDRWSAAKLERIELDKAKLPKEESITQLNSAIEVRANRVEVIEAIAKDEEAAIENLIEREKAHNTAIVENIEKINNKRRNLNQEVNVASEDLANEEKRYLANVKSHESELSDLRIQVKDRSNKMEEAAAENRSIIDTLERENDRLKKRVSELLNQKNIKERELREDGMITASRADLGFVIINLGWDNNIRPGMKFDVFNHRGGRKLIKGQIEVLRVQERIAHARVLNETLLTDPIIVGDKLHNPIYDPEETKVFVIKGLFERYSPAELQRFIEEAGGVVDNELSTRTHFLVAGRQAQDALDKANNYGVIILSENKLIEFIRMPE